MGSNWDSNEIPMVSHWDPIFALFEPSRSQIARDGAAQKRHPGELPCQFREILVAVSSRTTISFQRHPDEPPFSSQLAKVSVRRVIAG